jgi:hypothetical protein
LVRTSTTCPCSLATRIDAVLASSPAPRRSGWLIENCTPPWSSAMPLDVLVYCGCTVTVPPVASGMRTPSCVRLAKVPCWFCSWLAMFWSFWL